MRVWRLCREAYAEDPLGGRGGLFVSGRWHSRGRRVVYTAGSLALAALELLVHVDADLLPSDLVRLEIDVPDDLGVSRIGVDELPKSWRAYPAPAALRKCGDRWLREASTPVLEVPSAVVPEESNWVLNPEHADARRIRVASIRAFTLDPRLGSR